jgi:hypothetical protein
MELNREFTRHKESFARANGVQPTNASLGPVIMVSRGVRIAGRSIYGGMVCSSWLGLKSLC